MVDRIRYPTVSYLPFYYVFFQFLLLTIFNLQANILTTKDILSNLDKKHLLLERKEFFDLRTMHVIVKLFREPHTMLFDTSYPFKEKNPHFGIGEKLNSYICCNGCHLLHTAIC